MEDLWTWVCARLDDGHLINLNIIPFNVRRSLVAYPDLLAQKKRFTEVLCPRCFEMFGKIIAKDDAYACECLDCGHVRLEFDECFAWGINVPFIVKSVQLAMRIQPLSRQLQSMDDVYDLGVYNNRQLFFSRSYKRAILSMHGIASSLVGQHLIGIVPRRPDLLNVLPTGIDVDWYALNRDFRLGRHGIEFIKSITTPVLANSQPPAFVPDPKVTFTNNYRLVHIPDWKHGPILLTPGQASIFRVLVEHQPRWINARDLMTLAGLESDKPGDLFKIKSNRQENHKKAGALFAFKQLVEIKSREGLYRIVLD